MTSKLYLDAQRAALLRRKQWDNSEFAFSLMAKRAKRRKRRKPIPEFETTGYRPVETSKEAILYILKALNS